MQLCTSSHDAVKIFESLLERCFLNSETSMPCLGPDEHKTKRDMNSAVCRRISGLRWSAAWIFAY